MKSAWFWGTKEWAEYQQVYHHGQVPDEYKSSPLGPGHTWLSKAIEVYENIDGHLACYDISRHQTVVLDLTQTREQLWQGVRKSYHSIIHRAEAQWEIDEQQTHPSMLIYQSLHARANGGQPRPDRTYAIQEEWLKCGYGMLVAAQDWDHCAIWSACAYWIVYQGCAYYASGPSLEKNIQHAVIWKSIELLKAKGVRLVEMGEVCDGTGKEVSVQHFKAGFGGSVYPFTVARRRP